VVCVCVVWCVCVCVCVCGVCGVCVCGGVVCVCGVWCVCGVCVVCVCMSIKLRVGKYICRISILTTSNLPKRNIYVCVCACSTDISSMSVAHYKYSRLFKFRIQSFWGKRNSVIYLNGRYATLHQLPLIYWSISILPVIYIYL